MRASLIPAKFARGTKSFRFDGRPANGRYETLGRHGLAVIITAIIITAVIRARGIVARFVRSFVRSGVLTTIGVASVGSA